MRVLVTGADGFVGRYLVERLVETGHQVTAGCRPVVGPQSWVRPHWSDAVRVVSLELTDPEAVRQAVGPEHDAVVHLAAVSSVREAREDPGMAWVVNAAGTARLIEAVITGRQVNDSDPLVLVVSSAEVYGHGPASPRVESDPLFPQSIYAASKAGAEIAALEAWRRTGLRVVVARPFTHTGPGQPSRFVVPSFVERLLAAKTEATRRVPTGNLEPVRDLLDVRDVVDAYLGLLAAGTPGETYNVARGEGIGLGELFRRIAELIGVNAEPAPDPSLVRAADIPYLVGDASKLRGATGWSPSRSLEQTLRDMVDAQAH
jgi:GDP-4-dehydro-6-deoxy-D-mannose reductase